MLAAAALQVAGGIFIIYLGYSLASRPAQGESTLPAPNILSGMLLQLLNPKYPAVVLAVCAARPSQHIAVTVAAIVGVGAIGLLCYGTLGATFRSLFTADKYLRTADVVFGVLLALVGLWIAAQPFLQI